MVQLDFWVYKPSGFVNPDEDGRKLTKLDDFFVNIRLIVYFRLAIVLDGGTEASTT
jgi:hypothetical protein